MRPLNAPAADPAWSATLDPDVPFTVPVGRLAYAVELVAGPLLDRDGTRSASLVDHGRRTIAVDAGVPFHALPLVAAAAVAEAWRQVTAGPP